MRRDVWGLLDRHLPPDARVLDLGCGIGLDSSWLLDSGRSVVSVDSSPGMAAQARTRDARLEPMVLGAMAIGGLVGRGSSKGDVNSSGLYDGALLNFGVINCLNPAAFAPILASVLRPGAPVFIVSMPRVPASWLVDRLVHGHLRTALSRLAPAVDLDVEGGPVATHYWSGADLRSQMAPWFSAVEQRALGLFQPPPGSPTRPQRVARTAAVEAPLAALPGLRDIGDHSAVVLRRRQGAARPLRAGPLRRRMLTWRSQQDGHHRRLVVLILELTHGCQSRCGGCDHRGPAGGEALTAAHAVTLARSARERGCEEVLLTGGEALLRPDIEDVLVGLLTVGLPIRLLTNGLLLERHANLVARTVQSVVISLDGGDDEVYRRARGVDGLATIRRGLRRLWAIAPGLPVTARVTVSSLNAGSLGPVAELALEWGLDGISFLAADVHHSGAFGRSERASEHLVPDPDAIAAEIAALRARLPAGFVLDSDAAISRIHEKFAADLGRLPRRAPRCDAPWTSVVVGPDLSMRPCFFLADTGSAARGLDEGLEQMAPALAALRLADQDACGRCVCWARLT
jgi:Fe-coproporphyrin III synthase